MKRLISPHRQADVTSNTLALWRMAEQAFPAGQGLLRVSAQFMVDDGLASDGNAPATIRDYGAHSLGDWSTQSDTARRMTFRTSGGPGALAYMECRRANFSTYTRGSPLFPTTAQPYYISMLVKRGSTSGENQILNMTPVVAYFEGTNNQAKLHAGTQTAKTPTSSWPNAAAWEVVTWKVDSSVSWWRLNQGATESFDVDPGSSSIPGASVEIGTGNSKCPDIDIAEILVTASLSETEAFEDWALSLL